MITIGRHINGITINPLEYVLEDDGRYRLFEDVEAAKSFLLEAGIPSEEVEEYTYKSTLEMEWDDLYEEIQRFEIGDPELDKAAKEKPQHVWTVVEDGSSEDMYVVPGIHFVNRIFYIVSEKPWKHENEDYLYYASNPED
jgi:hypothetical protein